MRIWARTVTDKKITSSYIYETIDHFSEQYFKSHIEKICAKMDIPTPIIIKSHINNYVDFNNVCFIPRDFVESVNFDKFILENATLNK